MNVHNRPGRFRNLTDIVGQELGKLIRDGETTAIEDLKEYAALWHRMRASILLRLGDREAAIKDIKIAMGLTKKIKLRLGVYKIVASTPAPLSKGLFKVLIFIWGLRRKSGERN
jgi:hypothetical protein